MALIATHLGEIDEDKINNMSYNLFEDILDELGKKLNYEATANLAGNSFAKDAWKEIQKAFPMNGESKVPAGGAFAAFLGGGK